MDDCAHIPSVEAPGDDRGTEQRAGRRGTTDDSKRRVVASCPRNRHTIATCYVRAATKALAVIIGRRALAQQGIKKLSVVSAHLWSPETDREFLASGCIRPVNGVPHGE